MRDEVGRERAPAEPGVRRLGPQPDKNQHPNSTKAFLVLSSAYTTLNNPLTRVRTLRPPPSRETQDLSHQPMHAPWRIPTRHSALGGIVICQKGCFCAHRPLTHHALTMQMLYDAYLVDMAHVFDRTQKPYDSWVRVRSRRNCRRASHKPS